MKSILPGWLHNTLRVIRASISYFNENLYWFWMELTNCSIIPNEKSELANLMIKSHVLEKGITMPNRRLGFGYDRVRALITWTNEAIKKYSSNRIEIQTTLNVLDQYFQIHKTADFQLPIDIDSGITQLLKHKTIETNACFETNSVNYFSKTKDFREFAFQRHSVRWYDKKNKIDKATILEAIQLAQTAPSACNRQSTKVYVVEDEEKKQKILELQNGNRGFGCAADKIILLTTDMRYWFYRERTFAFLDAGIFCMNLLYALHYYRIGACTLNAHLYKRQRKVLQNLIGYDNAEIPVVFIAIGNVPEKFKVCGSQRIETKQMYKFV